VILETATLHVRAGREAEFEHAFIPASAIISSMPVYPGHELHRCVEHPSRYLLLVR
jgi:heme-degrading monooxygenase HmoA